MVEADYLLVRFEEEATGPRHRVIRRADVISDAEELSLGQNLVVLGEDSVVREAVLVHGASTVASLGELKEELNGNPKDSGATDGSMKLEPECRLEEKEVYAVFGPNKTMIPKTAFDGIDWGNPRLATRRLLEATFSRYTLATHSLTGKTSTAHLLAKTPRPQLDPCRVQDVVHIVHKKCADISESQVRVIIMRKCVDEFKLLKKSESRSSA